MRLEIDLCRNKLTLMGSLELEASRRVLVPDGLCGLHSLLSCELSLLLGLPAIQIHEWIFLNTHFDFDRPSVVAMHCIHS